MSSGRLSSSGMSLKDVDDLSKASHLPIAAYFNTPSLPSPSTLHQPEKNTKA